MKRTFYVNKKRVTMDYSPVDGVAREEFIAIAFPDSKEKMRVWWWGGDDNGPIKNGDRFFPGDECRIEVVPTSQL